MTLRRSLVLSIVYEFLYFLCFHTILAIIIIYKFGISHIFLSYLLIFPFYLLFLIRRKVKNIVLFLILNLSPFILTPLMPDLISTLVYALFCFILAFYSIQMRLNQRSIKGSFIITLPPLVVNFLGAVLNRALEINIPDVFFVINSTLSIICYILVTHISNIDGSLELLTSFGSQPVKPILDFNNRTIAVFALLTGVFASLSLFIKLDSLWSLISGTILAVLRFIFSLLAKISNPQETADYPESLGSTENMQTLFEPPPEPNALMILLEQIFVYMVYLLLIGLLLFGIGYTIYKFYKKFYASNQNTGDTKEFAAPLYEVKNFKFKKLRDLFPVLSKDMRIRRLFYKKVKSYLKKGVKLENDNTAKIISEKISQYEDIKELTHLYEKARYTNEI